MVSSTARLGLVSASATALLAFSGLHARAETSSAPAAAEAAGAETGADLGEAVSELVVVAPRRLRDVPGSVTVLEAEDYRRSQPLSINDVLRRVPGLYLRGEEGLGLRPNIGFRGLNPTRSSEVLLLEDGVPVTYAPYGSNETYYHPPLERFSGVEVLKGAGQIVFGPHTVGGVINYRTPAPPEEAEGRLLLRAGSRDTREIVLQGGDTFGRLGLVGGFTARESDGARDNHHLAYADLFLKGVLRLTDTQDLTVKLTSFGEDSQVSYSGLTDAEYRENPRGNPFPNDRFETARHGASLAHGVQLTDDVKLVTVLYGSSFERDWWRQSSNSSQRPNDRSDLACGGMVNLSTTCGNEGRLRQYYQFGLESRLTADWTLGGIPQHTEAGVRAHAENQERFQWNGDRPDSRSPGTGPNAGVREHNARQARALSGYLQNTARLGDLALTGGLRYETISFERSNKLLGRRGESELQALIPGAGITWTPRPELTVFAGVHRGFSPPRVEDVISDAGGSIELDEERSVNSELGVRARPLPGLRFEATLFRMDFENQIVPSSVAGGVGATLTSAGETLHQGLEGAFSFSSAEARGGAGDLYLEGALTYLGQAEYRGPRFSTVAGATAVSVTGNRLPYAPELTGRAAVGYRAANGVQGELEAVYTGEMFADDLNTVGPTADGQRGLIPDNLIWSAALSAPFPGTPVRLLLSVRNLFDETAIVDRSRGILVNEPRIAQVGVEVRF
jgi:Fe(3+) dicitrate transport protein